VRDHDSVELTTDRRLDTQQIELIGRNLLVGLLLRDGLEVARPERDRGIDLIAYVDLDETGGPFLACPLQLKAFTQAAFSVDQKYARFPNLLLAYLWNVSDPTRLEAYCLTYPEAVEVATSMGWTTTASWRSGIYSTTRPPGRLRDLLEPRRMGPGSWMTRVRTVAGLHAHRQADAFAGDVDF
jgi:hypothetical protein